MKDSITIKLINWIKDWFNGPNGNGCKAIIGISGGKDSTIVTKLCVEALGVDRVVGILMPNGKQKDIDDSYKVCEILGITYYVHDIKGAVNSIIKNMKKQHIDITEQTIVNLPARIRMSTLYAYAQSLKGRVINTSNYSEEFVGYSTRFGDSVGDMSPLGNLLVTDVLKLGDDLDLPFNLVHKIPTDGLALKDGSTLSDEDKLGVSYKDIDNFILGNKIDPEAEKRITFLHNNSEFKRLSIPTFKP